jgi:hypothetical protein
MAHCGFEGTAAADSFAHPWKALWASLRGPKLTGPFAADPPILYDTPAPNRRHVPHSDLPIAHFGGAHD